MVAKYASDIQFVLVYTIDAHPKTPDKSPYSGEVWQFNFSDFRQPQTYAERLSNAAHISDKFTLDQRVTILVDDLRPHNSTMGGDNPIWCGWGPAPNSAWLLHPNGTVALAQTWFESAEMDKAMSALVGRPILSMDQIVVEPEGVREAKDHWAQLRARMQAWV